MLPDNEVINRNSLFDLLKYIFLRVTHAIATQVTGIDSRTEHQSISGDRRMYQEIET